MKVSKKIAPAILLCLILTCCIAISAKADTIFTATLSGLNEVPANGSQAKGFISLDFSGTNLLVIETFSGLSSRASASHLHCCVPSGANGPVAFPFPLFPTATSGTFMQMFDLSKPSGFNGPSESVLLEALNAGLVYANISDADFPGGEIRGQLEPMSTGGTVPEPSVLLSVVMGLTAIAAKLKRR
jgi:hypothetical protein